MSHIPQYLIRPLPPATLETVYSWASQVRQYPRRGVPGVGLFLGEVPGKKPVNCLLYRDEFGKVVGILNYYDDEYGSEVPGNVNIWVRKDKQRQGIGRALVLEAQRRWGLLHPEQQRYTAVGREFVAGLLDEIGDLHAIG